MFEEVSRGKEDLSRKNVKRIIYQKIPLILPIHDNNITITRYTKTPRKNTIAKSILAKVFPFFFAFELFIIIIIIIIIIFF
jgi:hypothetical protein